MDSIAINDRYLIIGVLPTIRKHRFFRDIWRAFRSGATYRLQDVIQVDGVLFGGERRNTATSKEAYQVAGGMLMSGHGFEKAIIQDLLHPEEGQVEVWLERTT